MAPLLGGAGGGLILTHTREPTPNPSKEGNIKRWLRQQKYTYPYALRRRSTHVTSSPSYWTAIVSVAILKQNSRNCIPKRSVGMNPGGRTFLSDTRCPVGINVYILFVMMRCVPIEVLILVVGLPL